MDEAIKILLTYGPGGVIAALLILGVLIPKSFFDREVKRGDTATQAASENAKALREVSSALTINNDAIKEVGNQVDDLYREVQNMKNELIRQGVNRV